MPETPVRIYVGATEEQLVPCLVLEHSIRRHASVPVAVSPLYRSGIEIPMPRDPANRPFTTFSFQRFLIPEIQGFSGRAIYLDSDMLVFRDVREVWETPFDGAHMLAAPPEPRTGRGADFSVLLLDCAALRWDVRRIVADLDRNVLNYQALMNEFAIVERIGRTIPDGWNDLERFDPARTALLHYTETRTQPWLSTRNPLGHVWFRALFDALDTGFLSPELVEDHVRRGFLRPSLSRQIERRVENPADLPRREASELDSRFAPPAFRKPSLRKRLHRLAARILGK